MGCLARQSCKQCAGVHEALHLQTHHGMKEHVLIPSDGGLLDGTLERESRAFGIVLFVHGTGSNRGSPRNAYVASALRARGFSTLLVDLLTEREAETADEQPWLRFDVDRMAARVRCVTDWLRLDRRTESLPIALFGASTGAAAALVVAADPAENIRAVISRGGRPDLAGDAIAHVRVPTLLIVGSKDTGILDINQSAYERLTAAADFAVVRGASHLFEEPGALEEVAALTGLWLERHLIGRKPELRLDDRPSHAHA